jgi:DNA-binding transcriptional LysR family regulator
MLEDLEVFATVVEQSSINQASKILNLSQPAVSRKISNLEDKLGIKLFERKGKKLELTPIGEMSYEFAVEMRQMKRRFQQKIMEYKTNRQTSITVGASLTTLQSTLPDLISLMTQELPGLDIQAITGKTHEVVSFVQEKKVHLGLVASKIQQPGLICIPLFDDHLCLVVPKSHAITSAAHTTIRDLHKLPMILFSKGTWYRILMDETFHRYGVFPEIKMEIDSFEAILRLVSTIKIATLLPKSYLRENLLADNELVLHEIEELNSSVRTTSLIYDPSFLSETPLYSVIDKLSTTFQLSIRSRTP